MDKLELTEKVLKWVEREYGVMTADNIARDIIEKTIEEVRKRAKELLKEIEKKENEVNIELSEILDGKKKDTAVNRGALYGWGEALFWVKQKIKKAFSGVIEE